MAGLGGPASAEALAGLNSAFESGMRISASAAEQQDATLEARRVAATKRSQDVADAAEASDAETKSSQLAAGQQLYTEFAKTLGAMSNTQASQAADPSTSTGLSAQLNASIINNYGYLGQLRKAVDSGEDPKFYPVYKPVSVMPPAEDVAQAQKDRTYKNAKIAADILHEKGETDEQEAHTRFYNARSVQTENNPTGAKIGKTKEPPDMQALAGAASEDDATPATQTRLGAAHADVMRGLLSSSDPKVKAMLQSISQFGGIPMDRIGESNQREAVLQTAKRLRSAPAALAHSLGTQPEDIQSLITTLGGDASDEGDVEPVTTDPVGLSQPSSPETPGVLQKYMNIFNGTQHP